MDNKNQNHGTSLDRNNNHNTKKRKKRHFSDESPPPKILKSLTSTKIPLRRSERLQQKQREQMARNIVQAYAGRVTLEQVLAMDFYTLQSHHTQIVVRLQEFLHSQNSLQHPPYQQHNIVKSYKKGLLSSKIASSLNNSNHLNFSNICSKDADDIKGTDLVALIDELKAKAVHHTTTTNNSVTSLKQQQKQLTKKYNAILVENDVLKKQNNVLNESILININEYKTKIEHYMDENKKTIEENKKLKKDVKQLTDETSMCYGQIDLSFLKFAEINEIETKLRNGINSCQQARERKLECKICYDGRADCFFLDCGHVTYCMDCEGKLSDEKKICPICDRKYSNVRKINNF